MKVFKRLLTLALIGATAFSLMACGGSGKASSGDSTTKVSNKKTKAVKNTDDVFIVGFDQNFPPFGYVGDDGEFTGFDIDLAKETAKRLGQDISLQPIDWDAKDMELSSGTIDCIWNGFTINGREDAYTWSDCYMDNAQVFVVKSNSGIKDNSGLKGKTVDVQKDSSAESAFNSDENKDLKNSFAQMISVADYNTAMMDLESGAVDAVAMDKFVALDQIKDKKDEFTILPDEISSEQYAVGFKKGNGTLRDQVNKALHEMDEDGTFEKISKKWFGENVSILGESK